MASTAETRIRLIRRWLLLGLLAALGALAGLGYALLSHPVYTAKAYVVVVAQNPGDSPAAVSYAQAYARIAGQGEALNAAATASNGATSVSELRNQVRASTSPDAPVIEVAGSAGSARHAADLANLVANGLVSAANDHSADTRMKLTVLSAAAPPADPTSPQPVLDVAVGAAVGLLLGGLAVLAGVGSTTAQPSPAQPSPAQPSPAQPGPAEPTAPDGTEPAEGTAIPDMRRWTGRAPVSLHGTGTAPAPRQTAGPADGQGRTGTDDRINDDSAASHDGAR